MSRFLQFEACPECRRHGRDKKGDNLARYHDSGGHCFSCGYHEPSPMSLKSFKREVIDEQEKAVLPSDFTREVPASGWKWLLQYGLPYSYWKAFTGYSPKEDRLILTFGTPTKFSIGRALSPDKRKWRFYGDGHRHVEVLGGGQGREVVLVEDLISAHKVAQVTDCICLFGTNVHDEAVKVARGLKRPVVLWLDADQYSLLPKKMNRLQSLLDHPVRYVYTEKDPKAYDTTEITRLLRG